MHPRLTIGIPTLHRPVMLAQAIESCLSQTVPVRVLVMDQDDCDDTAQVVACYDDHPYVYHVRSNADCLWKNWRAAAEAALHIHRTEFFAWLQDDDVLRPTFAERVIRAFDAFPKSDLYMAPLRLAIGPRLGYSQGGNGPWVPMNYTDLTPDEWEGQLLVPTSYFVSHSLSPAVAFRNGASFRRALESMPAGCDLFQERMVPAATAFDGRFIADPVDAGLWIHHDSGHASYAQHEDQPRQTAILVDWLDDLMDVTADWQQVLFSWCSVMNPAWILAWIGQLDVTRDEGKPGRYIAELRAIMIESLKGRVKVTALTDAERIAAGLEVPV